MAQVRSNNDWSYSPNWAEKPTLAYSFQTAQTVSRYGFRQRGILREKPFVTISFSIMRGAAESGRATQELKTNLGIWHVPNWCVARNVTAKPSSTSVTFVVNPREAIEAADRVVIYQDDLNYTFANVTAVSGGTITVDQSVSWVDTNKETTVYKVYDALPQIDSHGWDTSHILNQRTTWNLFTLSDYAAGPVDYSPNDGPSEELPVPPDGGGGGGSSSSSSTGIIPPPSSSSSPETSSLSSSNSHFCDGLPSGCPLTYTVTVSGCPDEAFNGSWVCTWNADLESWDSGPADASHNYRAVYITCQGDGRAWAITLFPQYFLQTTTYGFSSQQFTHCPTGPFVYSSPGDPDGTTVSI